GKLLANAHQKSTLYRAAVKFFDTVRFVSNQHRSAVHRHCCAECDDAIALNLRPVDEHDRSGPGPNERVRERGIHRVPTVPCTSIAKQPVHSFNGVFRMCRRRKSPTKRRKTQPPCPAACLHRSRNRSTEPWLNTGETLSYKIWYALLDAHDAASFA